MALHDLDMDNLDDITKERLRVQDLVRADDADSERFWQPFAKPDLKLPSHIDTILDDLITAFDGEQMNPTLISSRVDTIMHYIVTAAKNEHFKHRTNIDWFDEYQVHYSIGQTVTRPWYIKMETVYLRSMADGILWYGEKTDLAVNLVVHKLSRHVDESKAVPQAAHLLLRDCLRLDNLYGIVTDSYKWHFLCLGRSFQYYHATYDWTKKGERQRIINHIRDIVDQAFSLTNTKAYRSNGDSNGCSLGELEGCEIWDDYDESSKVGADEDTGDMYE